MDECTHLIRDYLCKNPTAVNWGYYVMSEDDLSQALHQLKSFDRPDMYAILRKDDILINSTGAGTAGRVAQIRNVPCTTTVDGHMIILRANEKVMQRYLGYAIKAHQSEILQLDEGSTGQTELNRERLLDEIMIY